MSRPSGLARRKADEDAFDPRDTLGPSELQEKDAFLEAARELSECGAVQAQRVAVDQLARCPDSLAQQMLALTVPPGENNLGSHP